MGHSLEELEFPACSDGQVLKYSSGSLICGDDLGGATPFVDLECIVEVDLTVSSNTENCPAGYLMTGGGAKMGGWALGSSYPSGVNEWTIEGAVAGAPYAICCKVNVT